MCPTDSTAPTPLAGGSDALTARLAEFGQLYELVRYRQQVLDQRIPLAATALTATLGSVIVVPANLQPAMLIAIPVAAWLLFRSTVNHARSLEDALAALANIERIVNESFAAPILTFQSTHPSARRVGGRTGEETVSNLLIASLLLITGCAWLASMMHNAWAVGLVAFASFLVLIATDIGRHWISFKRYCYTPVATP